jgi:hypothetical protein
MSCSRRRHIMLYNRCNNVKNLEVTFLGKSWSIHAVKILAVRSDDVAARAPFVFLIVRSWPSDQLLALLTWSEPLVPLALHRPS